MIRFAVILTTTLILSTGLLAQNSLINTHSSISFKEGIELFQRKNYAACRTTFENWIKDAPDILLIPEAKYYIAISAINLFNNDGEKLIEDFILQYPEHPKAILAYYELANFYYRNRKYKDAAEYYEKIDPVRLNDQMLMESKFKEGYSWFNQKETEKALESFDHAKRLKSPYQAAAAYYAGFLNLKTNKYEEAVKDLEIAESSKSYEDAVPPLKAQAYYGIGDYDRVINYSKPYLRGDKPVKAKNEINLSVADSYFQKGEYAEAAGFYDDYLKPVRNPDPSVLLRAGYCEFQIGSYQRAEAFLKRAALDKDSVGQFSSFLLGQTYIKLDNKTFALTAFNKARQLDYSKKIQEEATFYYGKVAFDNSNYSEALTVFIEFKKEYPDSKWNSEVNDLISQSYLNTNNVDQALAYIESLPTMSVRVRSVYQKVTFKKGIELFNAGRYYDAVRILTKSVEYHYDDEVQSEAYYWLGEAYSIGNKQEEAIQAYKNVFEIEDTGRFISHIKAKYGIGYIYYNMKDYEKALGYFREYVEEVESLHISLFLNDALLRLADCYYATKNYENAIGFYDRAIRRGNPEKDYAYFQIGMIHGIEKRVDNAVGNFERVIEEYPDSRLFDDALFYKGQVTFENGNYELAIKRFTDMITREPQSAYIPQTYVNRAISYYNLQNLNAAIKDYQFVIKEYPQSRVANSALLGLQEAMNAANRTEELSEYIALYKAANPDSKDLASIEFESAKSLYFNLNYSGAIRAFREYLNNYPESPFLLESHYYLGESYYRNGDKKEAIQEFEFVSKDITSKWYNRAILKLAVLNKDLGNHSDAKNYFQRLNAIARNKKEQYNAWTGLMESYYELEKYDSVKLYAQMILDKGIVTANAQTRANLYYGKAIEALGNKGEAIDYYISTVNTANDQFAAESQYRIALIFYEEKEYRRSLETLFNLNENFSSYDYWIGKSFILIAKNYLGLKENFQVEATLNSVIERSPNEEIREEAKQILNELESIKEEAVQADTVQTDSLEIDINEEY
jgi:TolA-binding protein